jgi:hypothetical protein
LDLARTNTKRKGNPRIAIHQAGKKKALCTEIQSAFKFGGTSGGRTHDKRIKSAELCTTIRNIINAFQRG